MSDRILALALRAVENPYGLAVLGDAVQIEEWWDERMQRYAYDPEQHVQTSAAPTTRWAKSIVKVLWFLNWTESVSKEWPCIVRAADRDGIREESNADTEQERTYYADGSSEGYRDRINQRAAMLFPNERQVRVERYVFALGTIILTPGERGLLVAQPQTTFRGSKLVIPSMVCDAVEIDMIQTANININIGNGGVPGRAFSEEAVGNELSFPTINPAQTVRLGMTNITGRSVRISPCIFGISSY